MSYPIYDFKVDLQTSCSVEDAVAKLLGWLRSNISFDASEIDGYGVPLEKMPYLDTLVYSLQDHLADVRITALEKLDVAINKGEPEEITTVLAEKVLDAEDLAVKAQKFLEDINDELYKKDKSRLVLDLERTQKEHESHITNISLRKWALKKYKIDITLLPGQPGYDSPNKPTKVANEQRYDALRVELEKILDNMDSENIKPSKVMNELINRVGLVETCILRHEGNQVSWEDGINSPKILTMGALKERIKTWKKTKKQ